MDSRTQTLLSAVHALTTEDAFPSSSTQALHPFAQSDSAQNAALPRLKNILATASLISMALSSHLALPVSDPKLVSIMRQHAALTQELNATETHLNSMVKTLHERHGVDYGEDVPHSRAQLIQWFLAKIELWGKSADMQIFNEPENEGKLGVVLAGKILVVDIEFRVTRGEETRIELITLKSSHASPLDAPATSTSSLPTSGASLDTFMAAKLREYLEEIQKDREELNAVHIAKLGRALKQHLQYIMKLDHLAQREIEGGSRWFTEIDDLSSVANQIVPKEAETVARELSLPKAPLDILLLRGHALPLPYLRTPSLSFLVHLPPASYLTVLRASSVSRDALSSIDVNSATLRKYISKLPSPLPEGLVVANLSLAPSSQPSHFAQTHGRPTFPLLSPEILDDIDFQNLDHILPVDNGPDAWVLDFGTQGVVLSQSRMWEIQVLLGLAPASGPMQMMDFGYGGSWVDLVVQGTDHAPHERYTALHISPTNAHPPLRLRLTSPLEPGFVLHKLRVQSMRDIWAICEVVKEQSWYNCLLSRYKWSPEEQELHAPDFNPDEVTQEGLDAMLNGNITPRQIPVNLVFAAAIPPLYEPQMHRTNPALTMVFPSKDPAAPLINASIALDQSRNSSVSVIVNGMTFPSLEEFVRRGGGLGLAGQLWLKTGALMEYHEEAWNTSI